MLLGRCFTVNLWALIHSSVKKKIQIKIKYSTFSLCMCSRTHKLVFSSLLMHAEAAERWTAECQWRCTKNPECCITTQTAAVDQQEFFKVLNATSLTYSVCEECLKARGNSLDLSLFRDTQLWPGSGPGESRLCCCSGLQHTQRFQCE